MMTLREARLRRMWSMQRLAKEARVAVRTVWEIENGQTNCPRLSTMQRLADALGCSPEEIAWPGDPLGVADDMPTLPLAVVPSAAPESPEAEAHAAFWEAKRQLAFTLPEPARTAMLEMYSMKQYGRGDADLARRIHAEHVVDASPSPSPAPDDASAETPATPEPSRRL